jgi:hypothetical protein
MKRPTAASLKRVTIDNLVGLGPERMARILLSMAEARPELKRRLRMELAAAQGPEHLAPEIDKRLTALETSRAKISWRQRPTFLRELETLRELIAGRMAELDQAAALDRLWRFMTTSRSIERRLKDKEGQLAVVYDQAAADIGGLLTRTDPHSGAEALVQAVILNPTDWVGWLPAVLEQAPKPTIDETLAQLLTRRGSLLRWPNMVRPLADAAKDADAFALTFGEEDLRLPSTAAQVASRYLVAGRSAEAGKILIASSLDKGGARTSAKPRPASLDFDWESAWIDFLEQDGQAHAAQEARWASFERTLSVERAKAFTSRLPDFDDVEAEGRAFSFAAANADFQNGLRFLMDWPALSEASSMIQTRSEEINLPVEQAELWAAKLSLRQPLAANLLLRRAAAAAFRRRDYGACDRLTAEADALAL